MKKSIVIFVALGVLLIWAYHQYAAPRLPILTGYAAKKMCSCTFISGLPQKQIQAQDLGFTPVYLSKSKVDYENKEVTTSVFGFGKQRTVYREDLGCVHIHGNDDYAVKLDLPTPPSDNLTALNQVHTSVAGVDYTKLSKAMEYPFSKAGEKDGDRMTLAVSIFYKDTLIGEKYAPGYNPTTPILGWSMTKSITSALIGILAKNGEIHLDDNQLFKEWGDERSAITLENLLHMESGLAFTENYTEVSDATQMLYMSENVSTVPLASPLAHDPGTQFYYSSGTTNLLSQFIRNQSDDLLTYHRFPYDSLFHRIGMRHTTMETDENGTFIGSSYCYAPARDWGRFGLLFKNQGNWYGDQVIDSSWVDFCQIDTEASGGDYGGHFWQNGGRRSYPDAPEDLFYCSGFQGQYVLIIPSRDVVIVRLGLSSNISMNRFTKEVLEAID